MLACCNSNWAWLYSQHVVIAFQLTNYESGLSKLQSIIPNQFPYCSECYFGLGSAKLRKVSNLHYLKKCYSWQERLCTTTTVNGINFKDRASMQHICQQTSCATANALTVQKAKLNRCIWHVWSSTGQPGRKRAGFREICSVNACCTKNDFWQLFRPAN